MGTEVVSPWDGGGRRSTSLEFQAWREESIHAERGRIIRCGDRRSFGSGGVHINLVLQDANEEEAKNLNANINAFQNFKIQTHQDHHKIHSPQPKEVDKPVHLTLPLKVLPILHIKNSLKLLLNLLLIHHNINVKIGLLDDLIFTSGNISIIRVDIDDLLKNECLGDNHVYKDYKQPYHMFIQHINPDSVKESNLIIEPIIFNKHWILIISRLKKSLEII
ncbi:hypothetical protein IEQ34_001540 [Dendrobium chrysotoxum]|uniref:Ubiquitin-like protease family profile domain-containing protein n=1 Tax=Dendrobium chrysotoxum TaxID=161865 RepID=A0AAV7HQR9_DENCH|nr:hypothetical protein IEQ34_001540 [Dendrobium chrysotoxum]